MLSLSFRGQPRFVRQTLRSLLATTGFFLVLLGTSLRAQPSGASEPPPPLETAPPRTIAAWEAPPSGYWLEHWYTRGAETGNPGAGARFRVNDPWAAFQDSFHARREVRASGLMQIPVSIDVSTLRGAQLYLETWGGHAGTANKRFTINGRTTYALPETGSANYQCTHQYPSIALRVTDLVSGYNALQFACDRGRSFWGHFIVDEACLRLELPSGHAELKKAGLEGSTGRVEAQVQGETIALSLHWPSDSAAGIASVEFYGEYAGYDENGTGLSRAWHGFTRQRQPVAHLGTATAAPFRVTWDTSMLPAQTGVNVRALVRFSRQPMLVYQTPVLGGLAIEHPTGIAVSVFGLRELPPRYWSRAGRVKTAVIELPIAPDRIEQAELHTVAWAGGIEEEKDYFKLNGQSLLVAGEGHHRTSYTRFPVARATLRLGENELWLKSVSREHGVEILNPGPALVVRHRQ